MIVSETDDRRRAQNKDRCHWLMARLIVVEDELADARREYRRSDVVIVMIQAWLANPNASKSDLARRLAALGVEVTP